MARRRKKNISHYWVQTTKCGTTQKVFFQYLQIEFRSGIKAMTLDEQKSRFSHLQSFKIASNDMQNAQIESWEDFQCSSSILLSRHNVHIAIHDIAENNKEYELNTCSVETQDRKLKAFKTLTNCRFQTHYVFKFNSHLQLSNDSRLVQSLNTSSELKKYQDFKIIIVCIQILICWLKRRVIWCLQMNSLRAYQTLESFSSFMF